jgi:hypothetical protein
LPSRNFRQLCHLQSSSGSLPQATRFRKRETAESRNDSILAKRNRRCAKHGRGCDGESYGCYSDPGGISEDGPLKAPGNNRHDLRESWLRAAAAELRPYFANVGYPLPDNIRFAIAFPSTGRKGKRLGECWHSSNSDDASYEIFLRADLAEPVEVLSVLVKELVHTALPADAGHGKQFKDAAIKIGLQGPMRTAQPGVLLLKQLTELAATLGPLPHASLHIERAPLTAMAAAIALDRPKKQRVRMLKAACATDSCGYTVRVAASWVRDVGPPHCPQHGAMSVDLPAESDDEPGAPEEPGESV